MKTLLLRSLTVASLLLPTLAAAGVYEDMLSALHSGDTPAAIALLDRGVDVNTVDRRGDTLLILSVRENNLALFEELLARRARLNSRNRDGDTALRLAAFNGQEVFVQRLVEAGAAVNSYGWTPLAYAAFNGHDAIVDYLLKRGAEVDARSENGSTALMIAARNGHLAVVQTLLRHHAKPDLRNENGLTALDWAQQTGNTDIAEILRAAGAHSGAAVVIELQQASTGSGSAGDEAVLATAPAAGAVGSAQPE